MRDAERPPASAPGERQDERQGERQGESQDDEFTRAPLDSARTPAHAAVLPRALRGPRRRALTLAATTLLVAAVVVAVFVHATSNPGGAVDALLGLSTPTPAATFIPGANVLYFSNAAPWGTLMVDGKRLPQADLTGYGTAVTRGAHQLVYQARYFPTVRCVVSAPQAQSDTCPLDTSADADQFLLSKAPLARMVNLGSTIATLQSDQLAAIVRLANAQLQAQSLTATIAPGERYLDGQGRVMVASAPLQLHLTLSLGDTEGDSSAVYADSPIPPGGGWPTQVMVDASWAITDASGRRLTSAGYLVMDGQPISTELGIQLTSTGWKLTWLENLAAEAVENAASSAAYQAFIEADHNSNGMGFSLAPNPLDGCVMDVSYGDGQATARVLWRFGALVAVDAAAHAMLPQLPVANAQEQATVASIVASSSAP